MKHSLLTAAVSTLLLFGAISARPQNTTAGAIAGTIIDPTGAVVSQATVIITNSGTGSQKTVTTTEQGFYTVESLPDGNYSILITKPGFQQTTITNIHL